MRFAFRAAVRLGLAVFLAGVVTGAGAAEKEKQAEKLPGAAEVLERYTKAIGGKETFLKHKSQQASGTVQMPAQGMNGKLDVYALRPNKMLIKMSLPGIGDLNTAYNGSAGWIHSQLTGAMMMEGKMLEQMAAQADFDQALRNPADYKTLEVLGAEEFEGEDCFKLKLVHKTGFETTEFFSKKTGLQKGFIGTQESPLGSITATTVVGEYKKFGDMLMPAKISQKAAGIETIMTIESVQFDKVDAAIFEPPAEVKAKLEKPATAPEAPGKTE